MFSTCHALDREWVVDVLVWDSVFKKGSKLHHCSENRGKIPDKWRLEPGYFFRI